MKKIIRNGRVCFENKVEKTDLLIEEGRIAGWGDIRTDADEIIDATDCYVCPGFIDMHVHLDDQIGPYVLADDYRSGSQIAIENGITTLFNFVTQRNGERLPDSINKAAQKAIGQSFTDIGFHLTPTRFEENEWNDIYGCIKNGYHSFKFYTTYKKAGLFMDYQGLGHIMKKLREYDVQFLIHCEDDDALNPFEPDDCEMRSAYTHARLRPKSSEIIAIEKLLSLAREHQVRVHIVHTSTSEGVEMVHNAKKEARVTCETAPHYLYLDDNLLKRNDGYQWICSPPLRSESDRIELRKLALDDKIDVFATDHCPFTKKDKSAGEDDIRNTPNGIPGIGALIPLIFNLDNDTLHVRLLRMVRTLAANPAKITGCYPVKGVIAKGSDADLAILKSAGPERSIRSSLADTFETYDGFTVPLQVEAVLLRGQTIVRYNQIISGLLPQGKLLCQIN